MSNQSKFLVHVLTGGIVHAMRHLGTSLEYCERFGKIPLFEWRLTDFLKMPLDQVFSSTKWDMTFNGNLVNSIWEEELVRPLSDFVLRYEKYGASKYSLHSPSDHTQLAYDLSLQEDGSSVLTTGEKAINSKHTSQGLWTSMSNLRLSDSARQSVIGFHPQDLDETYIGAHFRNTDRKSDFSHFVDSLAQETKDTGIKTVFLATDDPSAFQSFESHLPDLKIVRQSFDYSKYPRHHMVSESQLETLGLTRFDLTTLALADLRALSEASTVIFSNPDSAWSEAVSGFRKNSTVRYQFFGG